MIWPEAAPVLQQVLPEVSMKEDPPLPFRLAREGRRARNWEVRAVEGNCPPSEHAAEHPCRLAT